MKILQLQLFLSHFPADSEIRTIRYDSSDTKH